MPNCHVRKDALIITTLLVVSAVFTILPASQIIPTVSASSSQPTPSATNISIVGIIQDNTLLSGPAGNIVPSAYTPHAPICIEGDINFTVANGVVGGTGTQADPYRISGWEFADKTDKPQISIRNTTKNFIVNDTYIHGYNWPYTSLGIELIDIWNGTIDHNVMSGKYYRGIYLVSVNNRTAFNVISNNSISGSTVGIWLHMINYWPHFNNLVILNKVYCNQDTGILFGDSNNNSAINNTVYQNGNWGIVMHYTKHTTVSYNRIWGNNGGIQVDGAATYCRFHHNDFVGNNGTGRPEADDASCYDIWNDSVDGNYFSDYTSKHPSAINNGTHWNESYLLDIMSEAKDFHPLVNPVNPPPSVPMLDEPAQDSRLWGNTANLSWDKCSGRLPIVYDVYFDTCDPPVTRVVQGISHTYHVVSTVDCTKYFWFIRAVNTYGETNSTVWNFTENAKPIEPQAPVYPANGTTGVPYGTVNVSWTNATDPDGDTMTNWWYVDNESSVTAPYVANGTTMSNVSADFTTLPDTTYFWRVRANDSYEWSNWSATWNFTTAPLPPDFLPVVSVLSPNGGEEWRNGTVHVIEWNATDDNPLPPSPVAVYLSTDNGTGWTLLNGSYPNNGSYAWLVPDGINSTECLVKVACTDSAMQTVNDTSNGTFTIINWTAPPPPGDDPPVVMVLSPDGSEVWNQSTIQFIKWNATDDKPLTATCINISYSANNGSSWTIIGYELGNNGTMAWLVPDTVNSTQCLVKVECTDSAMQTTIDTSNGTFTIREVVTITDNPPGIYLLAPKTFDTLYGGEGCMITWNATDDRALPSKCVNLSYSLDSGANWTGLAANHTNNGSFLWTVPRNDTTEAKVRVTVFDSTGQTATDTSGKFAIEKWNKSADTKPNITSTPPSTATVGIEWAYLVVANDTDVQWGDSLLFSLENAAEGMEINETSGLITWTPQEEGNYTVTVVVTDSQGLSANQTFSVKVTRSGEEGQDNFLMWGAMFVVILFIVFLLVYFVFIRGKQKSTGQTDTPDDRKKRIYEYIAKHPDDDSESISKALDMQKRDLETDVGLLVDLGYIEERRDGRHRRYTVKKPLEEPAKKPVIIGETPPGKGVESKAVADSVKPQPEITKKEEIIPADVKKPEEKAGIPVPVQQPAPIPVITEKKDVLKCPTCDAKVTADMVKCPECGERLKGVEDVGDMLECLVCNAKVPAGAEKCTNCGQKMEKEEKKKTPVISAVPEVKKEIPKKPSPVKSEDDLQKSYRDRIELHLFRYGKYRTEYTKPFEITQEGISNAIKVSVAKVGITLRRMEEDELVIKEKCRVKDKWRTLYVYFLTSKGEQEGRLLMEEKGKR